MPVSRKKSRSPKRDSRLRSLYRQLLEQNQQTFADEHFDVAYHVLMGAQRHGAAARKRAR